MGHTIELTDSNFYSRILLNDLNSSRKDMCSTNDTEVQTLHCI